MNHPTNFNETWQACITENAHSATTSQMQKVKGQRYTRQKVHATGLLWHSGHFAFLDIFGHF